MRRQPLRASYNAATCAERDHPPAGSIWTPEFIGLRRMGQSVTHRLGRALNRRIDEITLYADEDWPQVESGEHILIGRTCRRVSQRSRPCHDSTHEPINGARPVHFPNWRGIQESSSARDITLKPTLRPLAGKVSKRAGELGMAEWVDQVGDVVAKEADENGVLVLRIDRLAFVDRVTDRQVCLRRPI